MLVPTTETATTGAAASIRAPRADGPTASKWLLNAHFIATFLLLAAGCAALAFDLAVARWFAERHCPGDVRKLFLLSEAFAHGVGATIIIIAVGVLDPCKRVMFPRLFSSALLAGLAANAFKLIIGRTRPGAFNLYGNVWNTFSDWFPAIEAGHANQGCPSAHAATAWGLAAALSACYPRGRWLFMLLATCGCCQRLVTGSHFASDLFWGAALGTLIGGMIMHAPISWNWYTQSEMFLLRRWQLASLPATEDVLPFKLAAVAASAEPETEPQSRTRHALGRSKAA